MAGLTSAASTRIRKTFRYPESDHEDGGRDGMDEEEQEKMIEHLKRHNEERNAQYTLGFTVLPLIFALIYVPALLSSNSTGSERLLYIFSIASLLSTGYMMRLIPLKPVDPKGKRRMRDVDPIHEALQKHLPSANAAICGLLAITAYLIRDTGRMHAAPWLLCVAPGIVFLITQIARRTMLSVDIKELEGLRYDYKGA
ncbi:hypothetical protein AJ80_07936 [Polytolypa hystricis UAMH7299]|uniref:Uncharacterized protein n=1 Tax=Polytolypa hystricis (strain UAMH7299) TaxID=1447883 RepID=A0A2B7XGA8_POLH7|nr:hypothetical protein AJ80_07936 [Polytolypa hystricis UAMH7299]